MHLTFDDGNASDAEIALALRVDNGLTGDFFLLPGRIETEGAVSSAQVRDPDRRGMGIGSHGIGHVRWRGLRDAALAAELDGSRPRLEALCAKPIDVASIPFGRSKAFAITLNLGIPLRVGL